MSSASAGSTRHTLTGAGADAGRKRSPPGFNNAATVEPPGQRGRHIGNRGAEAINRADRLATLAGGDPSIWGAAIWGGHQPHAQSFAAAQRLTSLNR